MCVVLNRTETFGLVPANSGIDISYWKHEVGTLGFFKEVAGAVATGKVANTGSLRQMTAEEIKQAREKDGALSSKA